MRFTVVFLCLILGTAAFAQESYHLIRKIPIPGEGGFDYLAMDQSARRLYVSHGSQVEVLDADSGKPVGKIPDTLGVHGIAIAKEFGRGYVSDGATSKVTVFDLATLKTIAEIPTEKKPDAIIYDPATKQVFAFNGGSDSATVITAADGKVAATLPLGGKPEFAVADEKGFVFNNLEDKSSMVKIDSRHLSVGEHWPLAPCESPSSMAMDRANRRIFVGCRNKLMAAVNADSGKVVATAPIGAFVDATAFDSESHLIFNSNGEGTITIVHEDSPDKYSVVETVKTIPRARTLVMDPTTHQLFLSTIENGQFEVLVVGK